MGVTRQAVLDKASGWVGMLERTGNNDIWFADDWGITGQSWCFAFTQSCFWYAEISNNGRLPHESMYCPYGIAWARENGQAVEVGGGPIPGDIVFYSWDMATWPRWRAGTGDHVGIVEGWDGGDLIWTIEGNIGDPQGVYRKVRSISETVVCFWRPTVLQDTPPPPEEDMTPDQDLKLTHLFNIFADGNRWVQWFNESRSANGQIGWIHDPRDGKIYMVWGTMFKRWMSPEELAGYQAWWGARGHPNIIEDWSPVHIDSLVDIRDLAALVQSAKATGDANAETLEKVYDLAMGELPPPPPPEKILDVEASLAQATLPQLIDALKAALGAAKGHGSADDVTNLLN